MSLQTYIPLKPLSDFVHMFWYWEGYHPPHPKERILPGGMMELVINLTDEPMQIYEGHPHPRPHRIYGPIAAGARSQYFVVDTVRPASILAVWFKPGGAMPFFGVSAQELLNLHVPLDALWAAAAHDLYNQLLEAPTLDVRFRILEQALLCRLLQASECHRAINYALKIFNIQPQAHTIAEVVERIALSPTRFIQVFREDVGMTPKLFCRVQRFQRALRLIANQSEQSWTDIALSCGYYDQAHFINDFRALAGISPSLYAPQSLEHNTNLPIFE